MRVCVIAVMIAIALVLIRPVQAAPPNIVLIVADDLGIDDLGFSGSEQIHTPNLDELARTGVILDQGYAVSALCSPSRAGLMTGKYPQRFGHENNPYAGIKDGVPTEQITIAEVLHGTHTAAMVGKWHLGYLPGLRPTEQGFIDDFYGFYGSTINPSYFPPYKLIRGTKATIGTKYATTEFADEAVKLIGNNAGHPFFLYTAFNAAHVPLGAPATYLARYPNITDPKRKTFAAVVSALDDAVGRIYGTLVDRGIEKNTMILFMSDNGAAPDTGGSNAPLKGRKASFYEGGIRVPMFIHWPAGLPQGVHYRYPVSALDFLPTIAAAASVSTPSDLNGVDLLPYLRGGNTGRPHDKLFWRLFGGTPDQWSAVRVGDLKLIEHAGVAQVFDIAIDPGEKHNIATPQLIEILRAAFVKGTAGWSNPRW